MNKMKKKKISSFPLKNNFFISRSRNLNLSNINDEHLKSRTSSMLSGKSSILSKNNLSILKIMNDSKLFETKEIKICRICFEKGEKNNPLISPCLCEGSIKYVHQTCLKNWIKISFIKPEFSKCEICNFKYHIRFFQDKKINKVAIRKFILYIFCFFIGMVFIIGFFILCFYHYALDNDKVKKETKKLFLIISITVSLFIIFIVCILFSLYTFRNYTVKTFENYEVLNKNKNENIKNPFFPNFIQFNNFFSTGFFNVSVSNLNNT